MAEKLFGVDIMLLDDQARPPQAAIDAGMLQIERRLASLGLKETHRYEHERTLRGQRTFSIEVFADG